MYKQVCKPDSIPVRRHSSLKLIIKINEIGYERFAAGDAELIGSRPEAFSLFLQSEIQRWAAVIRNAGVKPD